MNELILRIASADGGAFRSEVLHSPFRDTPSHSFGPPLHRSEVRLYHELTKERLAARAQKRTPPELPAALQPQALGTRLFEGVFGGGVGARYRTCRDGDQPLRVRLVFRPDDPESEYLAAVPWETLYDPGERAHLARRQSTPIARDLALPQRYDRLAVELPLRILVVTAEPPGLPEVDLAAEKRRLDEALAPIAGQVRMTEVSTLREMRRALLRERSHVLHFMGHGGYLDEQGFGALFFEHEGGGSDEVGGADFGELLTDLPDLRLVVLNACVTARYSGAPGRPLEGGVATGVVQRTGRSVLAMQHPISDAGAIELTRTFYEQLAAEVPVDVALSEARLSLARDHGAEWATPVLYLTARDGRLFELAGPGRSEEIGGETIAAIAPSAPAVRLGIRSMIPDEGRPDLGRNIPDETDHHVDLRGHFDRRYIREDRLWCDAVLPELRHFLEPHTPPGARLDLTFAAHHTVAFATGWLLEQKNGLEVTIRQPTVDVGTLVWHAGDGSARAEREGLWEHRPDHHLDPDLPDVALALGVSNEVVTDALTYIGARRLPIGRLIEAVPAGGPRQDAVAGGAHALQLAQALHPRVRERLPHERAGHLHLFASAPNALLFLLGQRSRLWGSVTLYEYAFGAPQPHGRYRESLTLPPPGTAEPPPGW